MKFIDTKRFSPVIYDQENKPYFKDPFFHKPSSIPETEKQYEEWMIRNDIIIDEDWWKIEHDRCINGYTVEKAVIDGGDTFVDGSDVIWINKNTRYIPHLDIKIVDDNVWITGMMYFYLNFWPIKKDDGTGMKRVLNPNFTDLSWENWMIRDLMYRTQKDNLWAKCRQRGLSEEEACKLAWKFLFSPESQGVIVAGEEKYNNNTFKFVKRGLKHLLNTQFYKTLARNTDDYILSKYTGSEIYSRTAKDNPEVLSGLSPSDALFEEIGIWKKGLVIETAEYLRASQYAGGKKTGYSQYTGTGGELDDSVQDMEEIYHNPEEHNVLAFKNRYSSDSMVNVMSACFIPAWKFEIVDKDGNSLRKESEEAIMQYRAHAKPGQRYLRTTQKPLTPEELFSLQKGAYFGPEITQLLTERFFAISNRRELQIERRGRLEWINKERPFEGVIFKDDPEGWFLMVEEPNLDSNGRPFLNLYLGTTDSYDQSEAAYSESKGALHIRKRYLNQKTLYDTYVAQIVERPKAAIGGAELFYEHTAMACIYYGCQNAIEWSNPRIFDWYVNNGFETLLSLRPQMATANMVRDTKVSNRYGIDKSLKPHALSILKDKLSEEFISRMFIKNQIIHLAKFRYDPSGKKYNCDITVSTAYGELEAKELEFVSIIETNAITAKKIGSVFQTINGVKKRIYL